jgi:hypothetical protein
MKKKTAQHASACSSQQILSLFCNSADETAAHMQISGGKQARLKSLVGCKLVPDACCNHFSVGDQDQEREREKENELLHWHEDMVICICVCSVCSGLGFLNQHCEFIKILKCLILVSVKRMEKQTAIFFKQSDYFLKRIIQETPQGIH